LTGAVVGHVLRPTLEDHAARDVVLPVIQPASADTANETAAAMSFGSPTGGPVLLPPLIQEARRVFEGSRRDLLAVPIKDRR